jgi:hypothetical protein
MAEEGVIPIRGFLIHITHYDPKWYAAKADEQPFDLNVGLELVDAMAEAGLNLLIIDCADGVRYESHPELARHYSVPMDHLETLVRRARANNIEVVPKLNFAQSHYHRHNDWFRPHNALFDNDEYWRLAFELIDELIEVCQPRRFFHIGMDEDHSRSYMQYVDAILRLHSGLEERGLRTIIWNDCLHLGRPDAVIHAEKSLLAEAQIPKDIVQIPWHYQVVAPAIIQHLVQAGFETWAAPGRTPELVSGWKRAILEHAGSGLLLTLWIPCVESNRVQLLDLIRTLGPICSNQYAVTSEQ